jgi:HD-like signal output (HDOD) protein
MQQNHILDRVQKINILPTFPYIVGELISIIENPMSSASDLAKHMDPSMVGEVLRVANTAYFGTRNFRNIGTIEQAIAVIGYQHLSYIILHMPFLSMVKNGDFSRKSFIEHSIACGVLSKAISTISCMGNPNEVYIAGMVHDIGIIVMYRYFRNEWQDVNEAMETKGLSRVEAEQEVFSVDHGFVGALLLEHWNLPRAITEAVMYHHCPEQCAEDRENALVLNLGNIFVKDVDFKADFDSFDDFMMRHREFIQTMGQLGKHFSPSGEVAFFEKTYGILRDVKRYIEDTLEDDDGH